MTKPLIKIDIVSDIVCPWCYIGKRRLEKAIELSKDAYDFDLEYQPFELNPDVPVEGVDQKDFLSKKFGGEERYDHSTEQVTALAAIEGLAFRFENQKVLPNTRKAHAIVQLAKLSDLHLPLVENFFSAYFTKGTDLSKEENLIDIAVQTGLKRENVVKILERPDVFIQVQKAEQELENLGIRGVPFYIINSKYGVSGAQSHQTFLRLFAEMADAAKVAMS